MEGSGFDDALAGLEAELRWEHQAEAGSLVDGSRRRAAFLDRLRAVPPGEVVTLSCLDGACLRGRIVGVGVDVVTLGEALETEGARRARVVRLHEVRTAAVVRLVRDA